MTKPQSTPQAMPTRMALQPPREPPSFHGNPVRRPGRLAGRVPERVARNNKWDDKTKLRHGFFYLEGVARTWFESSEARLTSRESFKAFFLETFATVRRKERAEVQLHARVQLPNDSVLQYVEEMNRLFRRGDINMTEEKKLRFLIRGVKEQLFAGFVRNPPSTVAELIAEASTMEWTLEQRARHYDRPEYSMMGTYSEAAGRRFDDLRETIRAVVCEELRKLLPQTSPPSSRACPE